MYQSISMLAYCFIDAFGFLLILIAIFKKMIFWYDFGYQ